MLRAGDPDFTVEDGKSPADTGADVSGWWSATPVDDGWLGR